MSIYDKVLEHTDCSCEQRSYLLWLYKKYMNTQFDLILGESLKTEGQTQVSDHNQDFMEQARGIAVSLARRMGQITADDVRQECVAQGLVAPHPNCWGALFHGRGWKAVGYTKSKLPSNHARTVRVWEFCP